MPTLLTSLWLTPLWLAALAALLLPIVLHLWSRGRARRVLVGSVRLLAAGKSSRARRLRLTDVPLLLLRCLLLAALVLALAEPRLVRPAVAVGTEGVVLFDPAVRADDDTTSREPLATPSDLWSLLREADASTPPGVPIEILTAGRLAALRGARPTLRRPVTWRVVPLPRAVVAPRAVEEPEEISVVVRRADERSDDAAFVTAAIHAAAEARGARLELDAGGLDVPLPTSADVLVWLAAEPPSTVVGARVVVSDGFERFESCAGRLRLAGDDVEFRRCSPDEPLADAVARWRAPDGRTLLAASRHGKDGALHLHFRGRFHPAWSDLVFRPAFPRFWLEVLEEAVGAAPSPPDLRPAHGQGRPRVLDGEIEPGRTDSDLPEMLLWGLVAALFAGERLVAGGRR